MEALIALVTQWKAEGLRLAEPVPAIAVQKVFSSFGAIATPDVLALYSSIGGMHEMDKELWCLWPLDRIEQENGVNSHHGVPFADYMINSWCYRLKDNGDGTSAVLIDSPDSSSAVLVARSLAEFLEMYKTNAEELLKPAINGKHPLA
ncbi:hypothetical protein [Diaphorobacter caeni]|uniref:hypothetical protein n=1 Tax=Diaphorobacter caeni TaxID=2784387 RepID=UPI00188EF85F|nr:hypothetical protein [Diaphorobacter caeni]MBF5005068.1 hypothetical protein [Diaphorobacter caeni]